MCKRVNCLGDLIRNNGKVLSLTLRNEGKEKRNLYCQIFQI